MNFKEILELIDKVSDTGISAIEVEQAGTRLRIEGKQAVQPQLFASYMSEMQHDSTAITAPSPQPVMHALPPTPAERARAEEESDAGLHIITSPIVGTFYSSPNPEAAPFVHPGDRITKGKVLCIVEAMKLMNEIESEVEGVIVRVYPSNGQPVEYGEKLYAVRL